MSLSREQQEALRVGSMLTPHLHRVRQHMNATGITNAGEASRAVQQMTRQEAAENELLAYASQLRPEQVQHLARLEASGGPQAVWSALQATGLSADALQMFATTYDSAGSLQGVTQIVQGRLAEVAAANQQREAAEGAAALAPHEDDTAAIRAYKERSPALQRGRDPAFQTLTGNMCRALGIEVPKGTPPSIAFARFVRELEGGNFINTTRQPFEEQWDHGRTITELAKMVSGRLGEDVTPARLQEIIDLHEIDDYHDGLHARQATRDHSPEREAWRASLKPSPAEAKRDKAQRDLRSTLESKYSELESRDRAAEAKRAARPVREASAAAPVKVDREDDEWRSDMGKTLARAYDAIDRGEDPIESRGDDGGAAAPVEEATT